MSVEKRRYLLPGERDQTNSIVHRPGFENDSKSISNNRIYEAKENDSLLGILIARTAQMFIVDINTIELGVLSFSTFENGKAPHRESTKRSDLIFCRVSRADRWTQTELSVQQKENQRRKFDFGFLRSGTAFRCSLVLCEKLERSSFLRRLQKILKNFLYKISPNGIFWFELDENRESKIAVRKIILEHESENDIDFLLERYQKLVQILQEQTENIRRIQKSQTNENFPNE